MMADITKRLIKSGLGPIGEEAAFAIADLRLENMKLKEALKTSKPYAGKPIESYPSSVSNKERTDILIRLNNRITYPGYFEHRIPHELKEAAVEIERLRKLLSDTNTYYAECIADREDLRTTLCDTLRQNDLDVWKHVKTGGLYEVIGECWIEATNTRAVLYRSTVQKDSYVWCRPYSEFHDGRFVKIEVPDD